MNAEARLTSDGIGKSRAEAKLLEARKNELDEQ